MAPQNTRNVDELLKNATELVSRQDPGAIDLLNQAAEMGSDDALFLLGAIYREGKIVPADMAKAAECYERAARRDNAGAQCDLGWMLLTGDGIPEDIGRGTSLLIAATAKRDKNASDALSTFFVPGYGAKGLFVTVVCGLLLSIVFTEITRFSFIGEIIGLLLGFVAGFVFCRIKGFEINFPRLIWALAAGVIGVVIMSLLPPRMLWRLLIPVAGIIAGWRLGVTLTQKCASNFLAKFAQLVLPTASLR